ncbi:MAG: hypothetical protein CMF49_01965 [Legionellales bacterium]|nr:hypothetical protein [Legionellales bacterium]|tara:strand:- start:1922 stop:3127 length:1206 start_codon:yes stop_codon:yes gene_type:complete
MHELSDLMYIKNEAENMRSTLVNWANINSGTANLNGIKLMQKAIIKKFTDLNAQLQRHPSLIYTKIDEYGQPKSQITGDVIHFSKRPEAKRQIILCGHCDTVFSQDNDFQAVEVIDNNTLQGPGVADMKGGIIVMHAALSMLEQMPNKKNLGWQVFINADEETGSIGSASILKKLTQSVEYGFVYEPALDDEGTLAYHRKGSGNFSFCFYGKSAHVGRAFEMGKSAIVALSAMIAQLHALNSMKNLIVNIAKIQGGDALNQVPDFALCHVNVRTEKQTDEQVFFKSVEKIISNINVEYGIKVVMHGQFNRKPKCIDNNTAKLYQYIIEKAKHLDLQLLTHDTGGCCDGNNLSSLGIPNVDTLGVRGGKIHTNEEYIKLDSLVERAQLSAIIFAGLANGELV